MCPPRSHFFEILPTTTVFANYPRGPSVEELKNAALTKTDRTDKNDKNDKNDEEDEDEEDEDEEDEDEVWAGKSTSAPKWVR
jgi:hypothetical protein